MANIAVDDVSKVYPGRVMAVDHLGLDVRDGELLVLVGPSGCGKTTTLRLIAGLEMPTRGLIRLADRDVSGVVPRDRNIAMVFQQDVLYPHLTVRGNMAFGLWLRSAVGGRFGWLQDWLRPVAVRRRRRRIAARRVRRAARDLGIEHLLGRFPHQLSGGERRRVAWGRVLVRRPAAFLLDEPFSNLDAAWRSQLIREFKQLHRRVPTTTVLVTHDQAEALSLGERVAVMQRGSIRQIDSPGNLYEQPRDRFVAGFIGTPPMNFWEGELTAEEEQVYFVGGGHRLPLHAAVCRCLPATGVRGVTLGVRPADVSVLRAEGRVSSGTLPGRVTLVERCGHVDVTHVEVTGGGVQAEQSRPTITALADVEEGFETGERVAVRLQANRVHLFAAATGENLTRGLGG